MQDYTKAKREYDAVESALKMVKQTGYGFASASLQDIQLSKPEVVKQGSRYGVKLKAIAPSIHMIKVDVESTFEPIIGSKEQSEELIRYLLRDDGAPAGDYRFTLTFRCLQLNQSYEYTVRYEKQEETAPVEDPEVTEDEQPAEENHG